MIFDLNYNRFETQSKYSIHSFNGNAVEFSRLSNQLINNLFENFIKPSDVLNVHKPVTCGEMSKLG